MSTLWIMDLRDQFERGRQWIEENLNFDKMDEQINVHRTMTDYIGSLLSCYALTGDELFVEKAIEISTRLEPAWRTPTGLCLCFFVDYKIIILDQI